MTTLENQIQRSVSPLPGGYGTLYRVSSNVEESTGGPQKELVVLACKVLDAMIEDTTGDSLPVLRCLRKAFYSALYTQSYQPEFDEMTPLEEVRDHRFGKPGEKLAPPPSLTDFEPYNARVMWFESDAENKLKEVSGSESRRTGQE